MSYIDRSNNKIYSMIIAEFDAEKLSSGDSRELRNYFNRGEGSHLLESIVPTYIYLAIDFNDNPAYIDANNEYKDDINWPALVDNIYRTPEDAKKAFIKSSGIKTTSYKRSAINIIFKEL